MRHFIAPLILLASIGKLAAAQGTAVPPVVWSASDVYGDFAIARDSTIAHGGRTSVRFVAAEVSSSFATITATLPTEYAGKRLHVSAYLRTDKLQGAGGVVWARADTGGRSLAGAFVNSAQYPHVGTTDWSLVEITLDVPRSANRVMVGTYSAGKGTLWVDDIRITADSVAPLDTDFENAGDLVVSPRRILAYEAPRVLTDRGLQNLTALTHLLADVRFFHPSAEAVTVNWDEFAISAVRAVEGAPSADSLASALRMVFAHVAPTVGIYRTGTPAPPAPTSPSPNANVIYWQHHGVGAPSGAVLSTQPNVYASWRILVPQRAAGMPIWLKRGVYAVGEKAPLVPDPARPLQRLLGGGVSASLPVALYTTDEDIPDSLASPRPSPTRGVISLRDRATRLAAVALAWGVFQDFYPYHETVHTNWPAVLDASLRRAATDTSTAAFTNTMERLVAALHDGHGRVTAANMGVGTDVQLGWVEGEVVVLAAGAAGTAAGVRAGDVVTTIDSRRAVDVLNEVSELVSGATPQWVRTRALSELLAGPPGTTVTLSVRGAPGTAMRMVTLHRGAQVAAVTLPRPAKISEVSTGVFYVDLDRITDDDFNQALPALVNAKGIVFDMRGYPSHVNTVAILSHLTDSTIHSALFETPVATLPDRQGVAYIDGSWTIPPSAPRIRARIAFMTGGGAISYAESTMGVVEGYRLGEIVGEASAGTNGNVNPIALPGQMYVSWTGMLVLKRDGTPHHGVGIKPTIPVSPTIAGIRAGKDEVLERAVAAVTPVVP